MTKCTLNSTSAGCVDYTCENALTSDICTTNFDGKPCIYKAKCY
jgi:Notch-like protein